MEDKKCPKHNLEPDEQGACAECLLNDLGSAERAEVEVDKPEPRGGQPESGNGTKSPKNSQPNEDGIKRIFKSRLDAKDLRFDRERTLYQYSKEYSDVINANDFQNNQIGAVINNTYQDMQPNAQIPLFEKSLPLPTAGCGKLAGSYSELVLSLKKERILLLGDCGDGQTENISYQIAESLEIDNQTENIKGFSLSDHITEYPLDMRFFDIERVNGDETIVSDAVIIIDATKEGEKFADSLLNSAVSFTNRLPVRLRENKLYLICLLEDNLIRNWKGHPDRRNFPFQIIGSPKDETNRRENELNVHQNAERVLSSESDTDEPIIKTVLFVASFFPNLTTSDFNYLVSLWLRKEPDITKPDPLQSTPEKIVLTKISLEEQWNLKAHIFTERCFVSQKRHEQGKRFINFENETYREHFKKMFDSKFFVFLDKKISDILDFALIFHPSDTISSQSVSILSEYILEIEDKYTDWLHEVFRVLETVENIDEIRRRLRAEEIGSKHFFYDRLALLFRAMIGNTFLKAIVDRILEQLIRNKFHKSVSMLVDRLYLAPNFDGLYWIRQLLERGDADTQAKTLVYIFKNLLKMNTGDVFETLKTWLPDDKTSLENYSKANKASLFLLIDYYYYQTEIFDRQLYGAEPCQFPLFIFDGKTPADTQLKLIIKYLLHSANFSLLSEEQPYIYDVAYLLEVWATILYRKPELPGSLSDEKVKTGSESSTEGEFLSNREILDGLLEQVVLNSDRDIQEQMLSIWEKEMSLLDLYIQKSSIDWKLRENGSTQRRIVRNLIESFKKSRRFKK
jgi:hypothetical protein